MKSIVVANWKMNPASFKEAKKLFEVNGVRYRFDEKLGQPPFF